jgi:hypothetical protein
LADPNTVQSKEAVGSLPTAHQGCLGGQEQGSYDTSLAQPLCSPRLLAGRFFKPWASSVGSQLSGTLSSVGCTGLYGALSRALQFPHLPSISGRFGRDMLRVKEPQASPQIGEHNVDPTVDLQLHLP